MAKTAGVWTALGLIVVVLLFALMIYIMPPTVSAEVRALSFLTITIAVIAVGFFTVRKH